MGKTKHQPKTRRGQQVSIMDAFNRIPSASSGSGWADEAKQSEPVYAEAPGKARHKRKQSLFMAKKGYCQKYFLLLVMLNLVLSALWCQRCLLPHSVPNLILLLPPTFLPQMKNLKKLWTSPIMPTSIWLVMKTGKSMVENSLLIGDLYLHS